MWNFISFFFRKSYNFTGKKRKSFTSCSDSSLRSKKQLRPETNTHNRLYRMPPHPAAHSSVHSGSSFPSHPQMHQPRHNYMVCFLNFFFTSLVITGCSPIYCNAFSTLLIFPHRNLQLLPSFCITSVIVLE